MHSHRTAAKVSQRAKLAAMDCHDRTSDYPGAQTAGKAPGPAKDSQTYDKQRIPTRATGGRIAGEMAETNLGQTPRASGKAGKSAKGKTIVNVIVAPPAAAQPTPVPVPVPAGPPPGAGPMPDLGEKPPGAGLPMMPGGGAPASGPMPPMPARATGGRVKMTAGSRSGKGRLQKAHNAKMDREG